MTRISGPLLFNPGRASLDELEQTFVGRRAFLEQLEVDLLADSRGKTSRHWQLIGPRGTGKSHLTELLGHQMLEHGWAVVRLPEEHYQVASVGELLEQIVVRLEGFEVSPFRETPSPRDVEEMALDRLRGWRKKHRKPILVILENLGLLLERQLTSVREQGRLRAILMRDAPFTLLTTSTDYLESTGRPTAPFYDFFHTRTIEDLSRDEVIELVKARARWDHEEELLREFASVQTRLDALYHLSGGSPRAALALYSIIRQGIAGGLHHQLMRLLDEATPYHQARLRDVAPQMERVLVEMALAEGPLTPSELARRCRMATNQITANVTKLVAERLVNPGGRPDGRRRYYQVSDRLFRIWLQMREDTAARSKLRFLVEFFQSWYRDSIALEKGMFQTLASLARAASQDGRDLGELVSRLVVSAPPQQIRDGFIDAMPIIARSTGGRGALLLYRKLRDAGILPPDLPPYAAAESVEASPQPTSALEALHPEVREAVSLLLSHQEEVQEAEAAPPRHQGTERSGPEQAPRRHTARRAPSERQRTTRRRAPSRPHGAR
jgi:DNA-binding MarR family transcriptional regulator